MATALPTEGLALARQARERFVDEAVKLLDALPGRVSVALETLGAEKAVARETAQNATAFRQKSDAWLEAVRRKWRDKARERLIGTAGSDAVEAENRDLTDLALVGTEEMDRTVAAGRLALALQDKAGQELSDLSIRVQRLEGGADFAAGDAFRPEVLIKCLLDAWAECGLTHLQWNLAQDAISQHAIDGLCQAYAHANAFLMEHGVTAEIDLRAKMRRAPDRVMTALGQLSGLGDMLSASGTISGSLHPVGLGTEYRPPSHDVIADSAGGFAYVPPGSSGRAQYETAFYGGSPGVASGEPKFGSGPEAAGVGADVGAVGAAGKAGGLGGDVPAALAVAPLGLLQQRQAQSVLGNLRQFAEQHGVFLIASGAAQPISPVLALALAEPGSAPFPETQYLPRENKLSAEEKDIGAAEVGKAAEQIRSKAEALKDKAERPSEKATIEIVSLMFQAILSDERLPPTLRVWFGRLQVPVLRVALAEPEFFAAPDHPARRLIDRMGACALGLNNAEVENARLEQEVKRIVQVIEQYPETGKAVFQLVLEEFEKFLSSALAQSKSTQKFATLAQQIEQKDALTIQYTIELRNRLSTVPVSEDVRQFFFRVWAEVLALAAVRGGAQDAQTMRLKQAAADLLWAVGPKTDRSERQQVMQCLPDILKTLREGMQTLAMDVGEQDGHIRQINQAIAQAFHVPGQGITPTQMNQLAHALAGLEDVVTDDSEGDLLLDPALLEQMLGADSNDLQVISAGGTRPDPDKLQWARELQLGQWLTLHYQGAQARVQYVWRSARGQLHLFAAASGRSYLVQTRRLAAYLQAGLIAPVEEQALTIRATSEALARLDQAPGLLLHRAAT
jgi:hypothetical protein